MEVYIYYDGEQYGPATLEELKAMWEAGEIHADAHIWHTGLDAWVPAAKFRPPRMSPPPPPEAVAAVVVAPAPRQPETCPHCQSHVHPAASRCPHCQGEIGRCPKCSRRVAVEVSQRFVGMLRGGSKPIRKCMSCGTQLSGPRF